MLSKSLRISYENWKRLQHLRIDEGFMTLNGAISFLFRVYLHEQNEKNAEKPLAKVEPSEQRKNESK